METLTTRALNRALLARQMLLAREETTALAAVERLVGLQAQQPRPPFVGLWARVSGFQCDELRSLIESGRVVRATLMRATLHLMSREDHRSLRPALQPVLTGSMRSILRDRLNTQPLEAVLDEARQLLAERPRTFTEIRSELLKRFPDGDERAMGYAVRMQLPLACVPVPREWGFSTDAEFALAEGVSGPPADPERGLRDLVLRYLAAFGPATAADAQAWSGLGGLTPVLNDLRPQLRVFRDERRRDLFDLPEAPRPPEDTPAPVRFVADFDNLILSHADRTRVIADEHRPLVITRNALVLPTFLVDGFVAGTWQVSRRRKTAVLTVSPFAALSPAVRSELEGEGESVLRFLDPTAAGFELSFGG